MRSVSSGGRGSTSRIVLLTGRREIPSEGRKEGTCKAMVAGDCRSQKASKALVSVTLHLLQ